MKFYKTDSFKESAFFIKNLSGLRVAHQNFRDKGINCTEIKVANSHELSIIIFFWVFVFW